MAAHSNPASIDIPAVPPDQPPGAWPSWLRAMAEAINLLSSRVNNMPLDAADDTAAAAAGVPVGGTYRNGSVLMVRVA